MNYEEKNNARFGIDMFGIFMWERRTNRNQYTRKITKKPPQMLLQDGFVIFYYFKFYKNGILATTAFNNFPLTSTNISESALENAVCT